MKKSKISFLFFYIIFFFLELNEHKSFAQQSQDSLNYFSKLVQSPQNSVSLITAYNYFKKDSENALKRNDTNREIYDLQYIAIIEYITGSYDKSEKTAVEALIKLDGLEVDKYRIELRKSLISHLGILYRAQKNNEKAIELYTNAFKIAKTVKDSIILYNNISNVYKDINDYESAKNNLLNAYALIPKTKDTLTIALVKDNLGFIYAMLNIDELALSYMTESLALREKIKDSISIYSSKKNLSEFYKKRGNLLKARKNALEAYDIAKNMNSASYKKDALGLLTDLSEDNFAKAYKNLNDSLYNAEKESLNKFALLKYNVSEYKRNVLESKLQKEKEATKKVFFQFLGLLLLVFGIYFFHVLRIRHKNEKLQQVYNTEARISKKVHDEIANDMFQLMTKLQNEAKPNEQAIDDLDHLYNKTRDISKEHSVLDLKGNFKDILNDLILSYNNSKTNVIIKGLFQVNWDTVPEIKNITIYKVLQELLINMKKHSHASIVLLTFNSDHKKIAINYSDNGVGCTPIKNTGLQNVETRIASINGTVIFESSINKGFKAKITI